MANQHLFIYKQEVEGVISTNVKSLSKEERISTIAQMMAGVNPSEAVLESAREMMKR
jgi:DNA repair protein RecN (Recombination protein N)